MSETKNIIAVPLSIIVAGALIAGAVYFTKGSGNNQAYTVTGEVKKETTVAPVSKDDHILGNPEADVVIVEYSDMQCPYCKNFHTTMKQISDEYGKDGKVAWVYRHFPLDQIHPEARKAAEASECVASLGGTDAFWKFTNAIFTNAPESLKSLSTYATEAGVDLNKFNSCVSNGDQKAAVEKSYQTGVAAGVSGTPYSFIVVKGSKTVVPINGAQPYSVVKQVIDSLIKEN